MARRPRIEFFGAFYHVMTRGNQRQKTFRDSEDYDRYLQQLAAYKSRYRYLIYAYVLMPNHVHLLIETQTTPLSKILQGINQSYTLYFNKKYRTVGHLFQGRYRAILCDRDTYLLALVKYIHHNPERARIAKSVGDYPWSSHHAYLGEKNLFGIVDTELVLGMCSANRARARKRYVQFMGDEKGIEREAVYATIDQRLQGSEEFVQRVLKKQGEESRGKATRKAYPLSRIGDAIEAVYALTTEVLRSDTKTRDVSFGRKVFSLVARDCGYRSHEVARYLSKDPAVITAYSKDMGSEITTTAMKKIKSYLEGTESQ